MKRRAFALLIGVLLLAGKGDALAAKTVSRDTALSAIDTFQKDPSSKEGIAAMKTFMAFAKSSDAVKIYLSKDLVPWLKGQDAEDADTRSLLLAAYVAGNIKSQLNKGISADDPYAGWIQVIQTYDQLHMINPTVKLPEIDKLKEKEKNGSLHAYADEMLKRK